MDHKQDDDGSDFSDDDAMLHERLLKKAWRSFHRGDDLLFMGGKVDIDLATLHPDTSHILKYWQVYLENVNPLLKVTHTPTMQTSIIDAATNLAGATNEMHALMFAIYSISLLSLDEQDCWSTFGASRDDLLSRYQFACQQALQHADFMRTDDRQCLTALYLYCVSVLTQCCLFGTILDPKYS